MVHDGPKKYFSNALISAPRLRTKRIRASKSPWKKIMHYKDVLKVKAIRSGNVCDWLIFKKRRNAVKNEIKQAKEQFLKNALCENEGNSRMAW